MTEGKLLWKKSLERRQNREGLQQKAEARVKKNKP